MRGADGRVRSTAATLLSMVVLLAGCGNDGVTATSPSSDPPTAKSATDVEIIPLTTGAAVQADTITTTSGATTTSSTPPPSFTGVVHDIDEATASRMTSSWRTGCPVSLDDLRLLEITHFDFSGDVLTGELIVHADQADAIVTVFKRLFELEFPIEQMRLVDEFDGDDMLSMQANNTSAFNCRVVAGTSRWSEHAYGRAIDINPLINPWVRGTRVSPPEGVSYTDRTQEVPGLIREGDGVVEAFADIGWQWGGYWHSSKDYQHFSANGR